MCPSNSTWALEFSQIGVASSPQVLFFLFLLPLCVLFDWVRMSYGCLVLRATSSVVSAGKMGGFVAATKRLGSQWTIGVQYGGTLGWTDFGTGECHSCSQVPVSGAPKRTVSALLGSPLGGCRILCLCFQPPLFAPQQVWRCDGMAAPSCSACLESPLQWPPVQARCAHAKFYTCVLTCLANAMPPFPVWFTQPCLLQSHSAPVLVCSHAYMFVSIVFSNASEPGSP